jgi:hypothetical protein
MTYMGIMAWSGDKWYPDWEYDNISKNDEGAPKYIVGTLGEDQMHCK